MNSAEKSWPCSWELHDTEMLVKGKLQYSDLEYLDLPDLIGKTVTSALKTKDGFILGFDDNTALRVSYWKDLNILLYLIPSIKTT